MNTYDMAADTAKNNFLNNLRNSTSQSHTKLESLPVSLALVSKDITTRQYIFYLQLMYNVMADVEHNIFPLLKNVVPDIDQRKKLHLIENDLKYYGAGVRIFNELPFTDIKKNLSTAFAFGIMYVAEGSALGGRVILKNIEKALGLNDMNGCSYFAGYKSETSSLWKQFLEFLQLFQLRNNVESEIISGADFAFNCIYNFMQQKTTGQ